MEVISILPGNGQGVLAFAHVQVTPDIRVNNLRLARVAGQYRIWSPTKNSMPILTFSSRLVRQIRDAVVLAYEGAHADAA